MKKGANRKTSRASRKTRTNKTKSIKRGGGYQDEIHRLESKAIDDRHRYRSEIDAINKKLQTDVANVHKEVHSQMNDAMKPQINANDDQVMAYLNEVLRSGDIIRLRRFAELCSYFQQYKNDEYKLASMPRSETPAPAASYFNRASSALGSLFTGRQAETPKVNKIPKTNLFDDDAYLADMERK